MEQQRLEWRIDELNRMLIDEKHNNRKDKLAVAKLQQEVSRHKSERAIVSTAPSHPTPPYSTPTHPIPHPSTIALVYFIIQFFTFLWVFVFKLVFERSPLFASDWEPF